MNNYLIKIMKTTNLRKLLFLSLLPLGACTSENAYMSEEPSDLEGIVMTVEDFVYASGSRVGVSATDKGASFTWTEGDKVGIFPNEGTQVAFPITNGTGTKTASFNGGGWALKTSSQYMAYYPLQENFNLDKTKVTVTFEGQTQKGNNNTAHLGQYSYMAAAANTPAEGKVNFNFKHLCALVQLSFTLPEAETLTSVTLSSNEAVFVSKGTVDLMSETPAVVNPTMANALSLTTQDLTTAGVGEEVKVYMMLPPMNLEGKTINLQANGNKVYTGTFTGVNIEAGKVYKFTADVKGDIWVDLGLSVKWANCNLGANNPIEVGNYYMWGDLNKKVLGTTSPMLNHPDVNNISGNASYDAAMAALGEGASLPTKEQIVELLDVNNVAREWKTIGKVNGMQFTSLINGKSIFLPAAGYDYTGNPNGEGLYWGGTRVSKDIADDLWFNSGGAIAASNNISFGFSIRPVHSK